MSWIVGCISRRLDEAQQRRLAAAHPPPLHHVQRPGLYLAAGGLPETCQGSVDTGAERGWLALGMGLLRRGSSCSFASPNDWGQRLATPQGRPDDLDGHFIAIRWTPTSLTCHADVLGLRTLHLLPRDDGVYLSTRLDWLARAAGPLSLDFSALGSYWLGANQYAYRSLIEGALRLGPGGTATYTAGRLDVTDVPWSPFGGEDRSGAPIRLDEALRPFLNPTLGDGQRLSLGLSGGLDSRVLLAMLMARRAPFAVHVFGDRAHPDVQVALRIAEREGVECAWFRPDLPEPSALLQRLAEHVASTTASVPASAASRLGAYAQLRAEGRVCIDGFFGEVARRQYYKRLLARHRRTLTSGTGAELYPLLHVRRAPIFSPDAHAAMRAGMIRDLDRWPHLYASSGVDAAEDFADLLSVRFRLPNFAGYEQARLDGEALTYMPFAQRPFIEAALSRPPRERHGGTVLRRIVRRHAKALARYPLVKGPTTYPYALSPWMAWAWTHAKGRLGIRYRDAWTVTFLLALQEFVQDAVRSSEVRSYEAYDYERIVRSVDGFYAGDRSMAPFVDWWLSFELWRRSLAGH